MRLNASLVCYRWISRLLNLVEVLSESVEGVTWVVVFQGVQHGD